jgi:predicted Zn-dependent peptidase
VAVYQKDGRFHDVLDNGIELVVDPVPGMETLSIDVSFRVGSCDEGENDPHGIAHFLEHMPFKGTTKRSSDDINDEIAGRGGNLNASTDWDTTSFTCATLHSELENTFEVMADILTSPRLADDDIELERQVILQELEERKGTASTFDECFYASAYGEQAVARPIIGTEDGIKAISAATLRRFLAKHYTTGNLVVAVAGNVKAEKVREVVGNSFDALPRGVRTQTPTFDYYGGEQGFACSCEQGIVRYGFPYQYLAPDRKAYALPVFTDIVGRGTGSRLFRELREKRGLVYGVDATYSQHAANAMYYFETEGQAAKIKDVLLAMHDTIIEATETLTERELAQTKRLRAAWDAMGRDYAMSRTSSAVFHLITYGELSDRVADAETLANLDLASVKAAAKSFVSQAPTLAVHGPARGMPKLALLKNRQIKKAA